MRNKEVIDDIRKLTKKFIINMNLFIVSIAHFLFCPNKEKIPY